LTHSLGRNALYRAIGIVRRVPIKHCVKIERIQSIAIVVRERNPGIKFFILAQMVVGSMDGDIKMQLTFITKARSIAIPK
jgi:hypothetical protein